jgi:hypothetical protein
VCPGLAEDQDVLAGKFQTESTIFEVFENCDLGFKLGERLRRRPPDRGFVNMRQCSDSLKPVQTVLRSQENYFPYRT